MSEFQKATEVLERFIHLSHRDYEYLENLLIKKSFKRFWEVARYFKYLCNFTFTLYEYEAGVCNRHAEDLKIYVNSNSIVFGVIRLPGVSGYLYRARFLGKVHGYCQHTRRFYVNAVACNVTNLRYL
jgi:hypothetical protein